MTVQSFLNMSWTRFPGFVSTSMKKTRFGCKSNGYSLSPPPFPEGENLVRYIQIKNSPFKEPTLDEDALLRDLEISREEGDEVDPDFLEDLRHEFKKFLAQKWSSWAINETPRRKTIGVYDSLFGIQRAIEVDSAADPIELVWGIGIGQIKTIDQRLQYPLLVQAVEIEIGEETLNLSVRPRSVETQVELNPYLAMGNEGVGQAKMITNEFFRGLDRPLSPFDETSFTGVLRKSVGVLDSRGSFYAKNAQDPPSAKLPPVTDSLCVTDSWVLFVRPKSSHFLLQDIACLKEAAETATEIPPGPFTIFKEPSTSPPRYEKIPFRGISTPNPDPVPGREVENLYFPKPYNREQMQIAERLEQAPGVVAQGPPGTGKTHTIANIICHNLAKGRRILVTSKGEQALKVLKEQLPESIQPLAVTLLSSDRQAVKEMEAAVDNILQKIQRIDQPVLEKEIASGKKLIEILCAKIAKIENEVREWASRQLKETVYCGRTLMPEELARILVSEAPEHEWLPGPVKYVVTPFAVTEEQISQLRQARKDADNNIIRLSWTLPGLNSLPTVEALTDMHRSLCTRESLNQQGREENLPQPIANYTDGLLDKSKELLDWLVVAQKVAGYKEVEEKNWLDALWKKLKSTNGSNGETDLSTTLKTFFGEILDLEKERYEILAHPVTIPEGAQAHPQYSEAISRLTNGQPAFSLIGGIGKGAAKVLLAQTHILGVAPESSEDWGKVARNLSHLRSRAKIIVRWNSYMGELGGPCSEQDEIPTIRKISENAEEALALYGFTEKGLSYIKENLAEIFPGPTGAISNLGKKGAIVRYIRALEIHLDQGRLSSALSDHQMLIKSLNAHSNTLANEMRALLQDKVGSTDIKEARVVNEWAELLRQAESLHDLQPTFLTINQLAGVISKAGAKSWAANLTTQPASEQLDRLLPSSWLKAVEWHRLMDYLETIDGQGRLRELANELRQTEKKLTRAQEDVVEKLTWSQLANMSEEHRRALRQYAIAIQRIGAGKGKVRTPRFRREAREAMQKAVGAVPCWIMPHWRVSETLPSEIGRFDLVIIDEASQSDIWALPALLRGKKILVVGDDKQVSPIVIGKSDAALQELARQNLSGFDLGKLMGPESSIYDLAQVAFASDNICLQEHFRCVSPIISFSNQHWYNCLVPLRVPFASERIDPPLVDVFVKDGFRRDRDKTNPPEAQAIVNEIKALVDNPAFKGRTIGVISMFGQGQQAKRIFEMLFHEIGEEAILAHDIVCGDPTTFQGNEKDIVFLSMVDDPTHLQARTGRMWEQRFNVAASRARDRMYLYRSFRREDIRNQADLRSKLLDHFKSPMVQEERQVQTLRELCESPFEESVFDALAERGYRVVPQVSAGGFRIDMVVEGENNRRLAIECDGSQFHGPEKYFEDMSRQRVLERAGWTFWRCWGANYYRDPEGSIADLIETLQEMGIDPLGMASETTSVYTEFREVCGFESEDNEQNEGESTEDEKSHEDIGSQPQDENETSTVDMVNICQVGTLLP
jgi:very-short-patch-repair endonuclease